MRTNKKLTMDERQVRAVCISNHQAAMRSVLLLLPACGLSAQTEAAIREGVRELLELPNPDLSAEKSREMVWDRLSASLGSVTLWPGGEGDVAVDPVPLAVALRAMDAEARRA